MDSVDHLIALLTPIEVPATLGRYNRFSTDQTKVHGKFGGCPPQFLATVFDREAELEMFLRNSRN